MKHDNLHSLTPQIFFRLTKPLLEGKELPALDPAQYYQSVVGTKICLDVIPDLTFMKNDELLKRTADQWKES